MMSRSDEKPEDKPGTAEELAHLIPGGKASASDFRHLERAHKLEFEQGKGRVHRYWPDDVQAAMSKCEETCGSRQLSPCEGPPSNRLPKMILGTLERQPKAPPRPASQPTTPKGGLITTEELCARFDQPGQGGILNPFGKRMRWNGLGIYGVRDGDFLYDPEEADKVAFGLGLEPTTD